MLRSAKSEPRRLAKNAEQQLCQAIAQGVFPSGSDLPTEAERCQMLGVSRTVVREALRLLEEDGLVARRHGAGTFVRDHLYPQEYHLPDAFDFIVRRRSPTKTQGLSAKAAR